MLQVVFEPISNREDWIDQCEVRDENNALVDLTDAEIILSLRDKSTKRILLTATTDDSITIDATGIFSFSFTNSQTRGLEASKAYEVGCTIQLNGTVQQFFVGTIAVIDGIVS